jgi:hypothetical protein
LIFAVAPIRRWPQIKIELFSEWNTHGGLRSTYVHFCTFDPERFPGSRVMLLGRDKLHREVPVRSKQMTHFESESVMSDVCLGVAITGIYTLVGMGLVLVFM